MIRDLARATLGNEHAALQPDRFAYLIAVGIATVSVGNPAFRDPIANAPQPFGA